MFFIELLCSASDNTYTSTKVSVNLSSVIVDRQFFTRHDCVHQKEPATSKAKLEADLNVSSSLTYVRWKYRRSVSVFKTWSQPVITQTFPSLGQSCSKLIAGNSTELKRVAQFLNKSSTAHITFANLSNCTQVLHEFYDNFYTSKREWSFPIAFLLVVHTNVQQTLRFLKAIYRPTNVYCIHPDLKTGKEYVKTLKHVSKCLPNVFVPSRLRNVDYKKTTTIVEAQLSCLRDLEAHCSKKWRYVINVCSRELPLKTNGFIVNSLSKMKGVSIVEAQLIDEYTLKTRFNGMRHKVAKKSNCKENNITCIEKNEEFLQRNGIKLYKSMAYNALSFEFVRHLLHNSTMQKLTQWMLDNCTTPEEHLYATAYMIPGVPGGFKKSKNLPQVSMAFWKHDRNSHYYAKGEIPCSGQTVHQVCILNSADLPRISRVMSYTGTWFLNKYFMEEDHIVMDCVEELLISANKQEFYNDVATLQYNWRQTQPLY